MALKTKAPHFVQILIIILLSEVRPRLIEDILHHVRGPKTVRFLLGCMQNSMYPIIQFGL